MELAHNQSKIKNGNQHCTRKFKASHGVICTHDIAARKLDGDKLRPEDFNSHWLLFNSVEDSEVIYNPEVITRGRQRTTDTSSRRGIIATERLEMEGDEQRPRKALTCGACREAGKTSDIYTGHTRSSTKCLTRVEGLQEELENENNLSTQDEVEAQLMRDMGGAPSSKPPSKSPRRRQSDPPTIQQPSIKGPWESGHCQSHISDSEVETDAYTDNFSGFSDEDKDSTIGSAVDPQKDPFSDQYAIPAHVRLEIEERSRQRFEAWKQRREDDEDGGLLNRWSPPRATPTLTPISTLYRL